MTRLREAMLKIPTAPTVHNRIGTAGPTLALDNRKGEVRLEFSTTETDLDTEADRHLREEGLDPREWNIVSVRTSRWTPPGSDVEGRSAKYVFERNDVFTYPVEEVLAWVSGARSAPSPRTATTSPAAFLALIGDMQFGKIDGDGVDGTLARAMRFIDEMAARFVHYNRSDPFSAVVVAWMGDHGEGFVSQGGANLWRTTLTNTEQQRLTRRVMAYALQRFNEVVPVNIPVSMVAVPGNHGDTIRVAGKGVTKYNDSYDTEALVAVKDAVDMSLEFEGRDDLARFSFYVPGDDEIGVVLDLAGTRTAFLHGHFHRPGKHFEWLEGQAFDKGSVYRDVDLLVEGHLHHFHADTRSGVTFIGVPAVESESTWFRHRTGITGDPGCVVAVTRERLTSVLEVIR